MKFTNGLSDEQKNDPEIKTVLNLLQGIQGMCTTALLFKSIGWEVGLPDPDDDIDYEADLFVKNPQGFIYCVDVTAKIGKAGEDGREPEKFVVKWGHLPDAWTNVMRAIRVNVPPLISRNSERYYSSRALGFPNQTMIDEFKASIDVIMEFGNT